VSETWLREVDDRPLAVVDAVESELGAVDDGIRFGDRLAESVTVIGLPADLVSTAQGSTPIASVKSSRRTPSPSRRITAGVASVRGRRSPILLSTAKPGTTPTRVTAGRRSSRNWLAYSRRNTMR